MKELLLAVVQVAGISLLCCSLSVSGSIISLTELLNQQQNQQQQRLYPQQQSQDPFSSTTSPSPLVLPTAPTDLSAPPPVISESLSQDKDHKALYEVLGKLGSMESSTPTAESTLSGLYEDLSDVGSVSPETITSTSTGNITEYGKKFLKSLFPYKLTNDLLQQRRDDQYPFISTDYFISKANVFFDDITYNNTYILTLLQERSMYYEQTGKKPIIFIPSEFLLHFVPYLIGYMTPFNLITVSNQPFCLPYFKYPEFCQNKQLQLKYCHLMDNLLINPFLEKWYLKNPCIEHDKIIPLPLGPKWQFLSRAFLDENIDYVSMIYRQIGLKPFALFKNMTYMLQDSAQLDQYLYRRVELRRLYGGEIPPTTVTNGDGNNDQEEDVGVTLVGVGSIGSPTLQLQTKPSNQLILTSHVPLTPLQSIELNIIRHEDDLRYYIESWDDYYDDKYINKKYKYIPALQLLQRYYKGKDKLLYFNFEIGTTDEASYQPHTNIRRKIHDILINNGFEKSGNRQLSGYLQELSEYQFCICPPGKGIDTHRTWEALMVGTIPIVLSSPLDSVYDDLPVVIVKSFNKVTPTMLRNIYKMVHAPGRTYDFSKLFMPYWDELMK